MDEKAFCVTNMSELGVANEDHLKVLRGGSVVWNNWRKSNRIRPDLASVDIAKIGLTGNDLSEANFSYTNLRNANLKQAYLTCANFHKADLRWANLEGTHLRLGPNNCSSGYLLAFIGAGLTSVATSLAFGNFRELVAFFLAIVADHLDGFSKMAGMLGIDRRKRV
jgi:Pentapeptide repeats (8 copies)